MKKTTDYLIVLSLLLFSFASNAKTIESNGDNYEVLENVYAISDENASKLDKAQAQAPDIRKQIDESDEFVERKGKYQIYKARINSNSNSAQSQTSQNLENINKKQVLRNSRTQKMAVVNGNILLRYETDEALNQFLSNQFNLELANDFKDFKIAVLTLSNRSDKTIIDIYIELKNLIDNQSLFGMSGIRLDLLENIKRPN